MNRKILVAVAALLLVAPSLTAQNLSIDKVRSAYIRTSGPIMENNQIKGYFFMYMSDKVDRKTNEYTLQILDQNLNKVKDIKFEDSKKINLLEAAYNGSSLSFLFKNDDSKTLDFRIFDFDGKLKQSYSRDIDKRTDDLIKQYTTMRTDEGTNQNVFNVGDQGYVSVLPLRDGSQRTYEVNFFSSGERKQWAYTPGEEEERFAQAEYLGSTDSLIILQVMKKRRMMSGDVTSHLVGINFVTKRKAFQIDAENDQVKFVPTSISPVPGKSEMIVMGSYFEKDANIVKDFSKGLATYIIGNNGKIKSKTYNTWTEDFAKYLKTNSKGKIEDVGFLFIHKMIQAPNGKLYVVGEGYKRQANAGGIALNALSIMAGGGTSSAGVTKIVVTDMVVMEFNEKYKVTNAVVYDKTDNTAIASNMSDYNSQHALAMLLKMGGSFDYEFTTGESDNSAFNICYNDYERSKDYKGQTFNSIRYNGDKFSTDKIELKTKASSLRVMPAKPGFIMIMEYFRKDKRLDFRLEKLG